MGYTHYWNLVENAKPLSNKVIADLHKVFELYIDILVYESGHADDLIYTNARIRFNGEGEYGHETFYFSIDELDGFCKTARKPYDIVVTIVLIILKKLLWRRYGNEL